MKGIDALPETCYNYSKYKRNGIIIKKGEVGFFNVGCKMTEEDVARKNKKLGVSPEAEIAMSLGSLCGWKIPAVTEYEN